MERNEEPDPELNYETWHENGWEISGPIFKRKSSYLDMDGDNPEAPWPGYGWPLGTTCYYFRMRGHGWRQCATGSTVEEARERVKTLMDEKGKE